MPLFPLLSVKKMKPLKDKILSPQSPFIILASASPRREELIRKLGLNFQTIPPHSDDNNILPRKNELISPHRYALRLAYRKAEQVVRNRREGLIISADTIVVWQGNIFGKPRDRHHAQQMLRCLSGNVHRVITAVVIWDANSGRKKWDYDESLVKMKKLEEKEIEDYLNSEKPYDKAGAYGIQGMAGKFVERIEGSYFNVVGLPLEKLVTLLSHFDISVPLPKSFNF